MEFFNHVQNLYTETDIEFSQSRYTFGNIYD